MVLRENQTVCALPVVLLEFVTQPKKKSKQGTTETWGRDCSQAEQFEVLGVSRLPLSQHRDACRMNSGACSALRSREVRSLVIARRAGFSL